MLLKIIQRWLKSRDIDSQSLKKNKSAILSEASKLMAQGQTREAIDEYKKYLDIDPFNVTALNDLGVCLANIGNMQEAHRIFELAYSMDDSYVPAIVNHAKFLVDQKKSVEALPYLESARALDPKFSHVDAVYASLCLSNLGDVAGARYFQLQAWMANFENLRLANCYLFYCAYDDIEERLLAAEHRFWAETIRPADQQYAVEYFSKKKSEKVRIGYWSPDFRNHSVRYFFRPLQKNHDREKFEIIVYHDSPFFDEQTECIQQAGDAFHSVFELTNNDLVDLIKSHQLDILVELAGHTSNNRIDLLKERLAKVQITALGYPPTTGLGSVDAKLLDRHLMTDDAAHYYSEMPLVLPTSFWCFDPMEEDPAAIASDPPMVRNGYVTFGCVGNIAKINVRLLACWREILLHVPSSRLLIRSINFDDVAAEPTLRTRFQAAGLPMERVDLHKAEGGRAYFESYNDIDIVLDTTPFNGGTTTCFAVYMGVPVVSWAGQSLISRMGLSVMSNMGAPELVATDADTYIRQSVRLSQDVAYLRRFRQEARQRMRQTGLGNGQIFAGEFEQACVELLDQKAAGGADYVSQIDVLPAEEIVRRAYGVLSYGQEDAARRILAYCFRHYPDCGSAHILFTSTMVGEQRFEQAAAYLLERLSCFSDEDRCAALVHVARSQILAGIPEQACHTVERLAGFVPHNGFDQCQVRLYQAWSAEPSLTAAPVVAPWPATGRLHCLIPCDDLVRFDAMREQMQALCLPVPGWNTTYERCDEHQRVAAYRAIRDRSDIDIVLLVQKNIDIHQPAFFQEIVTTLQNHDVVGYAGATRWAMLDWISDAFEHKAGGFMTTSSEKPGFVELSLLGGGLARVQGGMAVLDGGLLAINRVALSLADCDADLQGAETLLEQAWSHAIQCAGGKLAVHRGLGVMVQQAPLDRRYWAAVRTEIAECHSFDLFTRQRSDLAFVSIPASGTAQAVAILDRYFQE